MTLDHAAIYVADLERAKDFFETYFGGVSGKKYHNPKTGLETYFISFGSQGARLELMRRPDIKQGGRGPQTGYAHIAFKAEGRKAVDALTHRLQQDGYTVVSGPRVTGDGYYESCIQDAEGNQIEIVA